MDAAARRPIEIARRHAPDGDAVALRRLDDRRNRPPARALVDAQFLHAPRAKRFEDRVDAVDQHEQKPSHEGSCLRVFVAEFHSPVRHPGVERARRTPPRARGNRGSSAGRSPAAARRRDRLPAPSRSSSGPSARPVRTMRMGWKSAFAFCPVFAFTGFAAARNASRSSRGARRQFVGQRARDRPRPVRLHLLPGRRVRQRGLGRVVEQKREPRGT